MNKNEKQAYAVEITETDQLFRNIPKSLNLILEESVRRNWERPSLSDFKGATYTYEEVAEMISKLHILYEAAGIQTGDKVAICGKNSAKWAIAFLACLTYGAVAVPILHEFKPETIHHLVNHSDAKLLFTDEAIWRHLDSLDFPTLQGVILISEFGMPFSRSESLTLAHDNIDRFFNDKFPHGFSIKDIHWHKDQPDDLSVINYTSRSTGMSKG